MIDSESAEGTPELARKSEAISRGLEHLVEKLESGDELADWHSCHFDLIVVGSGYGAAIAVDAFSRSVGANGKMPRICVLERGNEYLPGSFPTQMSDLAGYIRFATGSATARGKADGLFDIRVGNDVSAIVANGVGGGSLINAGVMAEPHEDVFTDARWPKAIRDDGAREKHYADAGRLLQAELSQGEKSAPWDKTRMLERLGGAAKSTDFRPVWITVALPGQPQDPSSPFTSCIGCGDCATGCNFSAKKSVDATLLAKAQARGVEIYSGATVRELSRDGDSWRVVVLYTDELLRARRGKVLEVTAKHVILAAGTLGSTEILMRSRSSPKGPKVSGRIGEAFSANGDMLAAAYGLKGTVNAVADPVQAFDQRRVGPTITGMIDGRTGDPRSDVVIQDLSVPGPLRKAFEESFALVRTLDELPRMQLATLGPKGKDPCAIDRDAFSRTLPVALIGHDAATGRLRMPVADHDSALGEGVLTVDWPDMATDPRRDASQEAFGKIISDAHEGGSAYANPLWRPLPAGLGALFGQPRGPLLTVHPLGGSVMGDDVTSGVVDHLGRVFDPDDSPPRNGGLHPGLAVLDGSIIPMSLGINPALTIAAVALRAVDQLVTLWGFRRGPAAVADPRPASPRAVFRDVPNTPPQPIETQVELLERVRGPITLRGRRGENSTLELTLCFQPASIAKLGVNDGSGSVAPPRFVLDSSRSWMRIRKPVPDAEDVTLVEGRLSGSLDVLKTERSLGIARLFRGVLSWVIRRAVRDGIQNSRGRRAGLDLPASNYGKNWLAMLSVCAHAGETRRLDYRLEIVKGTVACADGLEQSSFEGKLIRTQKRLTYGAGLLLGLLPVWKQSACNPWLQLSRMGVTRCPGQPLICKRPRLELYLPFLVERRSPLLRITQQQDHPAALGDLMSFALYVVRILIREHALSFRKPDEPPPAALSRLPGDVPGLPPPAIVELQSGTIPENNAEIRKGDPVMIRLTRYRPDGDAQRPPILLIHGYSASGTTFAHESLPCSLAKHFVDESRDVWVLDLRSSTGMPTARYPWSFEAIGFGDIPLAVDYVCRATNTEKIDVFAHCMGAAMLSMALLGDFDGKPLHHDTHPELRRRLPGRIARLVFSQIGPAMLLSPANLYRAYLLSYVKQFLSVADYRFRAAPSSDYSKVDALLDRLLVTLPYDDKEFRRENPFWPLGKYVRWASIRHRMDILYGRVFELAKMAEPTLNALDAFFGPLNFDTVAQVIHFAGPGCITDKTGVNCYVTPDRMRRGFTFPVLSIHGEKNGLADVKTLERMKALFTGFGGAFEPQMIPGYGHQDCLIGIGAKEHVFGLVSRFLNQTTPASAKTVPPDPIKVVWPSRGARFDRADRDESDEPVGALRRIVVDDAGGSGEPIGVALAPVTKNGSNSYHLQTGAKFCKLPIPTEQRHGPYAIEVPASFAPLGGLVAVALVYRQVACIGPDTSHSASLAQRGVSSKGDPLEDELVALLGRSCTNGPLPCLLELEGDTTGSRQSPPSLEGPLTFAFASCQYPEDLLDGSPRLTETLAGPADAAMVRLAKQLDATERRPQFLVLTGDQVYVDATAGLFDPRAASDRFRIPYENWLSSLGMRSVLGRLPVYMMLDDHEIGNNWEPEARHSSHSANTKLMVEARTAYWDRQRIGGPGPLHRSPDYLWAPVTSASVNFFLADTRTRRTFRAPGELETASILGNPASHEPDQFADLEQWLKVRKSSGKPSFVCSPALLLPRHVKLRGQGRFSPSALDSDAWDGYPASLYRILGFLCANEIDNAFFLSGDEHLGIWAEAAVEALDGKKTSVRVRSIHSNGLYSPYPFANGKPEDFAKEDGFRFDYRCARYRCSLLRCGFAPIGDGVTYITIDGNAHGTAVTARFDRADPAASVDVPFSL